MGTFFSAVKGQPCLGSKEHLDHFSFPLWPSCAESVLAKCCEHSTAIDLPARCSRLQREGAWRDGTPFPLDISSALEDRLWGTEPWDTGSAFLLLGPVLPGGELVSWAAGRS